MRITRLISGVVTFCYGAACAIGCAVPKGMNQDTINSAGRPRATALEAWQPTPKLMRYAVGAVFFGALAFMAVIRWLTPEQTSRYFGPGMGLVVSVIAGVYLSRGMLSASIRAFAIGLWLMTTFIVLLHGGLQTPIIVAYPVIVMLIAWLYSARAGFVTAGISSATVISVVIAVAAGALPTPARTPQTMYAVILVVVIWLAGILINALIRSYLKRLDDLIQTGADLAKRSDELQSTQDSLNIAIEATQMLFWDVDVASDRLLYDTSKLAWVGLELHEAPQTMRAWIALIHPAERESFSQNFSQLLLGQSPIFDFDYRMASASGDWIWLHTRGTVVLRSAAGQATRAAGGSVNITDRKRAEERLQLAAMALENSSEALMITDASNRIQEVNAAFTRLTGYERADVIGQEPSILGSGRADSEFSHTMLKAVEETGQWQGEIWNRRKNGEMFAEWLTVNTLRNDDGTVHRRVALFSDITEKKKSEELIRIQANFDVLTQLPNRRMFHDRLSQAIKLASRTKTQVALLFMDLDHFKDINDTLGHTQGDALLVQAAQRIVACVRGSDTVSRMGGDEFTVILTDMDRTRNVERIAQAIVEALSKPFSIDLDSVQLSVSIGISMWPDDTTDLDDLVKNADQAMYAAKNSGRGRFCYFTPAMQAAALLRLQMLGDMRSALAQGQFQLYFQPIVNLATGRITKVEALVRWRHPVQGMIGPASFIPLAEESGLIKDIGQWVFMEAARQVKRWQQTLDPEFQISVNVSPYQMLSTDLSAKWLPFLESLGLAGRSVVIEITEGLLLEDSCNIAKQLLAFRNAGVQLAIDDFGTGYSSLSYVQKLDIDFLKIDQSFVRNLATAKNDRALSESMIVMAHKLGLLVVAEGVETPHQRDLLVQMGSDYAQGYLYSRPVPAKEFEEMLASGPLSETVSAVDDGRRQLSTTSAP